MIVISVNDRSVTAYLCNGSGINSVSSVRGHVSLTSRVATNFHIGYDSAGRAFKGKMGIVMFIPQKIILDLNSAINHRNPMDLIHWVFVFSPYKFSLI